MTSNAFSIYSQTDEEASRFVQEAIARLPPSLRAGFRSPSTPSAMNFREIARLVPGRYELDEHMLERLGRVRVQSDRVSSPGLLAVRPILVDTTGYVIDGVHEAVMAVMRRVGLERIVSASPETIDAFRPDRARLLDDVANKDRYIEDAREHGITSITDLAARYAVPR